jgi:hypothetical protein
VIAHKSAKACVAQAAGKAHKSDSVQVEQESFCVIGGATDGSGSIQAVM